MKNYYTAQQEIKAPKELKERTLEQARQMRSNENKVIPIRRKKIMRRVVAAACALTLLTGGVAYSANYGDSAVGTSIANSFMIEAYAADREEITQPKDNMLIFSDGSGVGSPESGFMSGSLFKVSGENIATIHLEMDKEGLYRQNEYPYTDEKALELEKATTNGTEILLSCDKDAQILSSATVLSGNVTESYDSNVSYGFWLTPETYNSILAGQDENEDLQLSWHNTMDYFEGAHLTVIVTFQDGSTQEQKMTLHTGKMAVEYDENGSSRLSGELIADDDTESIYSYMIYGELEEQ